MMPYSGASCIMCLEGSSLNGIAYVFTQTTQIISGVLPLSFFANNLYGQFGIAEIRASMVDHAEIDAMLYRNEDIFVLTLFPSILSVCISLGKTKELDFWFLTSR